MGAVRSMLIKPIRTFNIESRTEKVLERSKPIPAPTFTSVEKQRELAKKLNPDFMEKHGKKDGMLDERLKKVFVTSMDRDNSKTEPSRAKPLAREQFKVLEYGVHQPDVVPIGKCSLRQAIKFLERHKIQPEKYTIDYISQTYKLDKQVVENMVKHFRILQLQTVDSLHDDVTFKEEPIHLATFIQLTAKDTVQSQNVRQKVVEILKKK